MLGIAVYFSKKKSETEPERTVSFSPSGYKGNVFGDGQIYGNPFLLSQRPSDAEFQGVLMASEEEGFFIFQPPGGRASVKVVSIGRDFPELTRPKRAEFRVVAQRKASP